MSVQIGDAVCRTDRRRGLVREAELSGVDEVEVSDDGRVLTVTFLGRAPEDLGPENVRIDGGRRITDVQAVEVDVERASNPEDDDQLRVTVDRAGDLSRYRLSIVETDPYGRPGDDPFPGLDQRYYQADFWFRPQCPSPFDCGDDCEHCGEDDLHDDGDDVVVDYTARDYDSLRRVVLERLALTVPQWRERNPADLGVTLAEILAYTGDQISYQQDAVATEAYLDTARLRVSVRRHTRLIDYPMHDGCNARGYVAVKVSEPVSLRPGSFRFAAVDGRGALLDERDLAVLHEQGPVEVFEPLGERPVELRPQHNTIRFWTWGDERCTLRQGAVSATLRDEWAGEDEAEHGRGGLALRPGDVLIFEEVRGPRSGLPVDADPVRRQAVRLTSVIPDVDRLAGQPVVEIGWAEEDALAFPLCLSSVGGDDCDPIEDVSMARGNVVPVDHGRSLTWCGATPETITVPVAPARPPCCEPPAFGCWHPQPSQAAPLRFRPVLERKPVVQAVPHPGPRHVGAGQAALLAGIPERIERRLTELWRSARDRDGLSDEEIGELAVVFGLRTLERLELRQHPVRALRVLLHRSDQLLAGKRRRLAVLVARARAGSVLDDRVAWEIRHAWGPQYATGLRPDDPVLHGPTAEVAQDPRRALPSVRIIGDGDDVWEPRRDLLGSGPHDRHFVGELGDDGRLALRFGDGTNGARPRPGSRLRVHYRVGGGTAGNVGAEAINTLVLCHDPEEGPSGETPVMAVRNPLPAAGGTEPEAVEKVRRLAPFAIKHAPAERAVTANDYAALASLVPGVQRAAAEIRWAGGVQEAHVAVDAYRTGTPSDALLERVESALGRYRRIGHDLVVGPALHVPLDIALDVCASPGHRHGEILAELYRVLGRRRLRGHGHGAKTGGLRRGFFHPDGLTFGEPVRLSRLVAVAAAVPGVVSVRVTRFRRLFADDAGELRDGLLRLGPLEVVRCDNDPVRPENGHLEINLVEAGGAR
ncbi:putative baseplate assembly protein [Actinomadura sp. 9N215]|uniref:putative baseplate assembly protein n=1 Tax=Actinomadura sp. 9N215 TaxID=3375150 RepID=UPI0037A16A9E